MPLEKRRAPRSPFGKMVAIVTNQGTERHNCLVTDISDGGVRIQTNDFDVPDVFTLLFRPDGPTQSGNYKVVWRAGRNIGAKFVGAIPHDV
jgi:PilZ domain